MVFRLYWKQAGDRQNMIIRQLNIKNSGEIHDKTLEFSPGINVLYGENESERAIVHTYIKNMFLGDISEAIYDNAVFAAKLKSPTEQDLARELQKFMTGYQGTADSSMDLGRAMQMLKMSRKGYLVQADRKQKETEQERQKLLTRMDDIISDLNDLNRKLDQINEKEESLRMHPGDENGAVILDERMAQAKAKRNSFAMGMLISAAAGIFGLILTAIIADSVSVSLIVAVIAAALVGFCGKQQLKYAREFQKRKMMIVLEYLILNCTTLIRWGQNVLKKLLLKKVKKISDRTMMRKKQNFVTLRKNTGNTKKILFCLHRKSGKYRL
mgnify:CR=1 FL=1